MQLRPVGLALASACALLLGCGDDGDNRGGAADAAVADAAGSQADAAPPDASAFCAAETRDDDYAPGLARTGDAGYRVVLLASEPGPPHRGDNAWDIRVEDADGAPVAGLDIAVYPFMPDHGHGTPVQAEVTAGDQPGEYRLTPINLFMSGFWTIRLTLRAADDPDTDLDVILFRFCV